MKKKLTYLLLLLAFLGLSAQIITVPEEIQAKLLLKILTFERNLSDNSDKDIVIHILYQENFSESNQTFKKMKHELTNNAQTVLNKRNVSIYGINLDKTTDLGTRFERNKINIFLLAPLRAFKISDITRFSREQKILTLTTVPEYVSQGISVGIDLFNSKPKILINLKSAKLEGADFSSQILKISKIIDE